MHYLAIGLAILAAVSLLLALWCAIDSFRSAGENEIADAYGMLFFGGVAFILGFVAALCELMYRHL